MSLARNMQKRAPSPPPADPVPTVPRRLSTTPPTVSLDGEPEIIRELVGKDGKIYSDPRPDLLDDSDIWLQLLVDADAIYPKLYPILHGFRCAGARLRWGSKGWMIRPELDPTGRISAWPNQARYEEEKSRWLKPYISEITALLKNLHHWKPASQPAS